MKNTYVKALQNNVDKNEINKFFLLLNQLEENELVNIGSCSIRKVSSFIFKIEDVSLDFIEHINIKDVVNDDTTKTESELSDDKGN